MKDMDTMDAQELVALMAAGDALAASAVRDASDSIALAARQAAEAIKAGGRLVYVGAGTSGRLGVLDASEVPPTFSSNRVVAVMAGGIEAVTTAKEGAEDNTEAAVKDAIEAGVSAADMVLGITASGTTPYVLAFLEKSRSLGASTWLMTCSAEAGQGAADNIIRLVTGAEVIEGSTRLKAGTATKMALNMISTTAMVILGGAYKGLMVDVAPTNAKLIKRAEGIIMQVTGCDQQTASKALKDAGMNAKTACVMVSKSIGRQQASELLSQAGGTLRKALRKD